MRSISWSLIRSSTVFHLSTNQLNRMVNYRAYNREALPYRLLAPGHIDDQGASADTCVSSRKHGPFGLLHAPGTDRLRDTWNFPLYHLGGRLRSNITRCKTSSPEGKDDVRLTSVTDSPEFFGNLIRSIWKDLVTGKDTEILLNQSADCWPAST
ncbi:MAG: hypothetical protein AMS17_11235 [Spirochaetes bacterium DG_61]|nr:MAG: hypothetical protein AMS17_11235 [Spirochaetes bacterium DG_61]